MTTDHIFLTLVTGLELIVLLSFLVWALRHIQQGLETIQKSVAKIYWGVRAIETETNGLRGGLPQLRETLVGVVGGTGVIAERLSTADGRLGALAGDPPA